MQSTKTILLLSVLLATTLCARLDFNSKECNIFLEKFGTADNADGSGASKIAFAGDVSFIGGTANVKVNVRYSDVASFNDPKYYGLVQQDGNTPEQTCLDMKLFKYTSSAYADKSEVTTLTIVPSNNFQKQWRYYSFTIKGEELNQYLVQTTNSNQFIYNGYFAIAYYAAGTDQLQYTFFFQFSVTIDKATGSALDTAFKPLSQTSTAQCNPDQCTAHADTSLKWCKDLTCTEFVTPNLHLNDQFVLQQVINTKGMEGYYLVNPEVWYTGEGLNKKASIVSFSNSVKGQLTLQLKAEIAWTKVVIKVTSVLSTTATGNRRLLVQTTYDTISGETDEITCIKVEGEDRCATCAEQKEANGYSSDACNETEESLDSKQIFIGALVLLAMIL
ncbi:unnamed protein product (macronuclear) [Paramecium tetraurelia]|uniref:Uncharacterized protein n=1 Tax=Paramecium tetraurelia TaxID=5888 RepID=A0BZB7_PARTE|nr:uncharacterized protein GSPATT00033737001 [Paramecium tetraurelia]CAK63884.1 unnamed protein product [Paramecium tetraurelia]|eukprot:XP_001431282.1 hypothetical protein (macronuclear) [Paramecium tetraurelia strain d4-2]